MRRFGSARGVRPCEAERALERRSSGRTAEAEGSRPSRWCPVHRGVLEHTMSGGGAGSRGLAARRGLYAERVGELHELHVARELRALGESCEEDALRDAAHERLLVRNQRRDAARRRLDGRDVVRAVVVQPATRLLVRLYHTCDAIADVGKTYLRPVRLPNQPSFCPRVSRRHDPSTAPPRLRTRMATAHIEVLPTAARLAAAVQHDHDPTVRLVLAAGD